MRRAIIVPLVLGLAVCAGFGAWAWRRAEAIANPYARYYRLKVDLTDRQGRPVGFDIVVGCSLRYSTALGSGRSVDPKGMSARVFAQAIPGGHAVSVVTNDVPGESPSGDPCQGDTTGDGIQADWLPMVVWYERAEDLSHGVGYYARWAYDSPASKLRFGGATFTKASAADFRRFRERGPQNLVPHLLADSMIGGVDFPYLKPEEVTPEMRRDPRTAWSRTSWLHCHGLQRWPVPPAFAERVRAAWPADRPRFWRAPPDSSRLLDEMLRSMRVPADRPWVAPAAGQAPRRRAVLPTVHDDGLSRLTPETFADGTYHEDTATTAIAADDGFVSCDRPVPTPLYEAVTGRKGDAADQVKVVCRIDGEPIVNARQCAGGYFAFERTDYLYSPLGSIAD